MVAKWPLVGNLVGNVLLEWLPGRLPRVGNVQLESIHKVKWKIAKVAKYFRGGVMEPANKGKSGRWQKGQSGNPSGRPKSARLAQACRAVLALPVPDDPEGRTYAEVIALTLANKAVAGDVKAAQELADRAEGKVPQAVEVSPTSEFDALLNRMTVAELERFAAEGILPAWAQDEEGIDGSAENEEQSRAGTSPDAIDEPKPPAELSDRV